MPTGRYFLADAVLTALLALRDEDCRLLLAAFDQIAGDPLGAAIAAGRDWDGRLVYLAEQGHFEIGYIVAAGSATVTITLLRPKTTRS